MASGFLERLISGHDQGLVGVLRLESPDIRALDEHPYHNEAQACLIRESNSSHIAAHQDACSIDTATNPPRAASLRQ